MHGHYCFDGSEPPVSVHFDMVNMHDAEHSPLDKTHIDAETNPSQTTLMKILALDLPFLAIAFLLIFVWPIIRTQGYTLSKTPSSWLTVTNLRPPLRAPPATLH